MNWCTWSSVLRYIVCFQTMTLAGHVSNAHEPNYPHDVKENLIHQTRPSSSIVHGPVLLLMYPLWELVDRG